MKKMWPIDRLYLFKILSFSNDPVEKKYHEDFPCYISFKRFSKY